MEAPATDKSIIRGRRRQSRFWCWGICAIIGIAAFICSFLFWCGNPLDGVWFNLRGRTIDQYGAPVPDATIVSDIRRSDVLDVLLHKDFGLTRKTSVVTDAGGNFHLWGFGMDLRIDPTARGYISYVDADYELSGSSSSVRGAPSDPVYRLWKLSGPEPLISCGFDCADELPHWLDLLHARQRPTSAGAELCVQITMPPLKHGGQFAWSYALKAMDGGLIKTKDLYPFLAPKDGYQPEVGYRSEATRSGSEWVTDRFYLCSRSGGIFGLVRAEWRPEAHSYTISALVNPSGSRVLEPGLETKEVAVPHGVPRH